MKHTISAVTLSLSLSVVLQLTSCRDGRPCTDGSRQQTKEHTGSDTTASPTARSAGTAHPYTAVSSGIDTAATRQGTPAGHHAVPRQSDLRRRTVSKFFANATGDTLRLGRAQLAVPCHAMRHGRLLSITPLRKGELPGLPTGMVNVTGGCDTLLARTDSVSGYRFLPHGEHFVNQPASITVPYDTTLIPKGYTTADIHTYYFDEMRRCWTMLKGTGIDTVRMVAMAETSHFTDVINGIIKVPESPETQSYVPTGISELKAADPSAGIQQVQAPAANQDGTATLSYPFETPAGRGGIAAGAALQYCSDGGSSFAGYGWSLPVQSIDIETRWGVPRFDEQYESESYLFMGQRLSDRLYRQADLQPRQADKTFQPTTEGDFSKIIRRGGSPRDYYWEVTAKDGTVYSYGGHDGHVSDESTLTDGRGNRVRWALTRITDVHGNFAAFHYTKAGNNLYPSRYTWTGFGDEEGPYSIEFETAPSDRKDVVSSGRLGVMQTDRALLRRVTVRNNGQVMRSYVLSHEEGAFGKTMLKSVEQLDSRDAHVATQSFDYYNDVEGGLFSGEPEVWEADGDDGHESLITHLVSGCDDNLSILGGGHSKSKSTGFGTMVGVGIAVGTVNVGPSYSHTKNTSTGKTALVDIDGDGLPDKLFQKGGRLYYRKNLNADGRSQGFGEPTPISGISSFSNSVGTSNSTNVDAAVEVGISKKLGASLGISYSHTKEQDKTTTYLYDFNSDGLMDVAAGGRVFFNHIVDGKPVFTPASDVTANPIIGEGAEIDGQFVPDYEAIRDSLEDEYPLNDAVRMWRAPFDGTVSIESELQKQSDGGDGIVYSIQHEGSGFLLRESLQQRDTRKNTLSRSVRAGDRIFFRLQSGYDGDDDKVLWRQKIRYTSLPLASDTYLTQSLKDYDSSEDFMEGESDAALLDRTGRVTINAPFVKGQTTDDVTLTVTRTDIHGTSVLKQIVLPADATADDSFDYEADINQTDSVSVTFGMSASSPVDWGKIRWLPRYKYDDDTDSVHIVPSRHMFNKPLAIAEAKPLNGITAPSQDQYTPALLMAPSLAVSRQDGENDREAVTAILTLHDGEGLPVLRHTVTLNTSNRLDADTVRIQDPGIIARLGSGSITATFVVDNELASVTDAHVDFLRELLPAAQGGTATAGSLPVLVESLQACVFSGFNSIDFGRLYRGWGQFAYNGNKEYARQPIDISVLNIDKDKYKSAAEQYQATNDGEALSSGMTPVNQQRFLVMGYNTGRRAYVGGSDQVFISRDAISSSRIGESTIQVDEVAYTGNAGELSAPVLVSESEGDGYAVFGGITYAGLSGSKSSQKSYSKVAVMDINGDGYPDWLREDDGKVSAQYTKATGALGDERLRMEADMPEFKASATTIGAEASYTDKNSSKSAVAISINPKPKEDQAAGGGDANGVNASNANMISSVSVSASGNFTSGDSHTERDWTDLNGDGLPDMLYGDRVVYGLGYGFTEEQGSNVPRLESSENSTWGAGMGTSIGVFGNADISFGFNGTRTTTRQDASFVDVNGDGLPDMLTRDGDSFTIALNTGDGFLDDAARHDGTVGKSLATSVSGYGNFAVSIPIHILFLKFRLTVKTTLSASEGVSYTQAAVKDIDGDGLPDLVYSDGGNRMKVRRNLTGRTNMLKTVTLPFGGRIDIGYAQTMPSYDSPGRKWVMSSVETTGGYEENGAVRTMNTFEYDGGYRDRREREFYGFRTVRTNQHDTGDNDRLYRYSVQHYDNNRDYHAHGLLTGEELYDAEGRQLQGTTYEYDLRKVSGEVRFPALTAVVQTSYDETTGAAMTTKVENDYDRYGNLTVCNETATDYELDADIEYHSLTDRYIVSVPKSITVKSAGTVYRQRSTEINGRGDITQITFPLAAGEGSGEALYNMEYDQYGNILKLTKPENHNGERMHYAYTYDDTYHSLVTNIKDAYGYSSSTDYDALWNMPRTTTDLNGQRMEYTYDDMGRPATIRAPYEIESGQPYTIKYEYFPENRKAHTLHYSPEGDIETWTFADDLMRAVQTKQTGVVWNAAAKQNEKVSIVSGRTIIDAFGRKTATYYSVTEPLSEIAKYSRAIGKPLATTEYDTHDRTVSVTLADGAKTESAYTITQHGGEPMLLTKVTDALGRQSESYTDEKGRNRETVQHAGGEDIRVKYDYDPVGQVTTVHHPNGTTTAYTYDMLGRKLSVKHPDAGEVICTYDPAGNMLTKLTSELKNSISDKGCITYTYDYERLKEVLYPKNLFNRVTYTYGAPGDRHNRAGRLALVEDASGGEAYYYGRMGEVTKTVRTVMASVADIRTYVYGATYDSWNRVRTMTYPDGEVVTYHYNEAGQVESLTSNKLGTESVIIERTGYDKDGHTVYVKLGNGTETTYNYDDARQRLQEMNLTSGGSDIMRNKYQYDAVDNILGISNTANPQSIFDKDRNRAKLGGSHIHSYQYDELNRLIHATGKAKSASYDMAMTFNNMSMPLTKVQNVDSTTTATSYHNIYRYEDSNHPTAPTQIGHDHYEYDANGNPTMVVNDSLNTTRELYWDEDNRLMVLSDNGKTSRYTYNHAGERIVKSHGDMEGVYINGAPQGITFHETDEFTLYPASIISVNKNRFTKHYFIGDKRIASRIGSGKFNNVYGRNGSYVTAGQQDYAERMNQIESQKEDYYKELGIAPGVPTMKGAYGDPENTGVGYNTIITELGDHSVPEAWAQYAKHNDKEDTAPGAPIAWDDPVSPEEPEAGYGFVADDSAEPEETFFYHSDHLGSTSYITDDKGNITQYDAYLPYGELLVDEHSSSEEMPYKFNGKELDEETGLYYYGARYMQPVASIWYGVDPQTENMPQYGAYSYCFGNPIKLIDPDGERPTEEEAARIADHVYQKENITLIGGWKVSNLYVKGMQFKDADSGFKSALYERTIDGKTEYVYATAGTDFKSPKDWENNIQQLFGRSKQYSISMNNAKKISQALDGKELTFVGHSLGGGMAAANAYKTGRSAITFNAAWVSPFTILPNKKATVDAYVHTRDELNYVQKKFGVGANGIRHWRINNRSVLGHSIKNFYRSDRELFEQKVKNAQHQYIMNSQNLPFAF